MFNKKAMAQWRQVNGNQSVPIERFLELASGNQQTQPQQPQQQQSTQPATQNTLQTAQQHVTPTAQSQQLVNTMNRNQIQQQLGSSSTTPIVITSTNSNIAQNTLITQPTSLFIVVSLKMKISS